MLGPSVKNLFRQRLSGHAFVSAGAPILGLVLLVIVGAFVVFMNFAQEQDRNYVENTRRLVANTLHGRLRALSDVTLDYANWNDAYSATTVRWNGPWLEGNFYSAVTDAMAIFRRDGAVRYMWKADSVEPSAETLAAQIAAAARGVPSLASLALAPRASGTVTQTLARLDGRLAFVSIAAIAPEDDAERLRRATGPVDYLAAVDIIEPSQLAAIGAELDLRDFNVTESAADSGDLVVLPLRAADGALLGYLQWRNQRPGSAAFVGEIGPVVIGVVFIGILSIALALVLMRREVAAATRVEAALESSRLKSEFISNMSHELRTPLDAIIGYAELIQEEVPKSDLFGAARADASRIASSAGQLRRLIDDVLDLSRIDAGRLQLAPEPIEVGELFAEIEDVLEAAFPEQAGMLKFSSENALLALTCDHQRLRQCLINLAENSLKFTRTGEIEISAKSAMLDGVEHMVFEVRDNGVGITRAAAATLFEPFAPLAERDARPKRGGTLALSISRKLARAMGGDLTFAGEPSGGACFTLAIPANAQIGLARAA